MKHFGSWCGYMFAAGLAASQLGCAAVTGEDYKGTPLARLHGVVTSEFGTPQSDIAAAVIWVPNPEWYAAHRGTHGMGAALSTLVDVKGEFPANFQIALYEPPPEVALDSSWDETPFSTARGRVVAIDRARMVDNGDGTFDVRNALIGSSDQIDESFETTQFEIWYLSDDPPAFWRSALKTPGYHLVQENGYLGCVGLPLEYCRDAYTVEPDFVGDVVDAYCRSPHQVHGSPTRNGGGPVPMDTPLTLTVLDQPLYIVDGFDALYSVHDIPTCTFPDP